MKEYYGLLIAIVLGIGLILSAIAHSNRTAEGKSKPWYSLPRKSHYPPGGWKMLWIGAALVVIAFLYQLFRVLKAL